MIYNQNVNMILCALIKLWSILVQLDCNFNQDNTTWSYLQEFDILVFHSHSVSQHYYNLAILFGLQFNVCFIASSTVVAGRGAQITWTDWSLMSVKLHTSWNKMWRKLWIVVRGLMTFRHALVRRSVLCYVHAWT